MKLLHNTKHAKEYKVKTDMAEWHAAKMITGSGGSSNFDDDFNETAYLPPTTSGFVGFGRKEKQKSGSTKSTASISKASGDQATEKMVTDSDSTGSKTFNHDDVTTFLQSTARGFVGYGDSTTKPKETIQDHTPTKLIELPKQIASSEALYMGPTTSDKELSAVAIRTTGEIVHTDRSGNWFRSMFSAVGTPPESGAKGKSPLSKKIDTNTIVKPAAFNIQSVVKNLQFKNEDNNKSAECLENKALQIVGLLFSASCGDISSLRRFAINGMDMGQADYDRRTALHLAASEGHLECVDFLLSKCNVDPSPKDRWGHTPLNDANEFGHKEIQDYLIKYLEEKENSEQVE